MYVFLLGIDVRYPRLPVRQTTENQIHLFEPIRGILVSCIMTITYASNALKDREMQ